MMSLFASLEPHPHLTSPWKGEGPAGVFGSILPQSRCSTSPFQGEVGWGSLHASIKEASE